MCAQYGSSAECGTDLPIEEPPVPSPPPPESESLDGQSRSDKRMSQSRKRGEGIPFITSNAGSGERGKEERERQRVPRSPFSNRLNKRSQRRLIGCRENVGWVTQTATSPLESASKLLVGWRPLLITTLP